MIVQQREALNGPFNNHKYLWLTIVLSRALVVLWRLNVRASMSCAGKWFRRKAAWNGTFNGTETSCEAFSWRLFCSVRHLLYSIVFEARLRVSLTPRINDCCALTQFHIFLFSVSLSLCFSRLTILSLFRPSIVPPLISKYNLRQWNSTLHRSRVFLSCSKHRCLSLCELTQFPKLFPFFSSNIVLLFSVHSTNFCALFCVVFFSFSRFFSFLSSFFSEPRCFFLLLMFTHLCLWLSARNVTVSPPLNECQANRDMKMH